jgi:hypothetical protein
MTPKLHCSLDSAGRKYSFPLMAAIRGIAQIPSRRKHTVATMETASIPREEMGLYLLLEEMLLRRTA